jgi:hypothetical protein
VKTIALFSALALGALTSAALAGPAVPGPSSESTRALEQTKRIELADGQMDKIRAGVESQRADEVVFGLQQAGIPALGCGRVSFSRGAGGICLSP